MILIIQNKEWVNTMDDSIQEKKNKEKSFVFLYLCLFQSVSSDNI